MVANLVFLLQYDSAYAGWEVIGRLPLKATAIAGNQPGRFDLTGQLTTQDKKSQNNSPQKKAHSALWIPEGPLAGIIQKPREEREKPRAKTSDSIDAHFQK